MTEITITNIPPLAQIASEAIAWALDSPTETEDLPSDAECTAAAELMARLLRSAVSGRLPCALAVNILASSPAPTMASSRKAAAMKITEIPTSEPGARLADLIELILCVDAPIDPGRAEMAARAWIGVEALALELGRIGGKAPGAPLGTLLGMFALGMCSPADTDSQALDPKPASSTTSSSG